MSGPHAESLNFDASLWSYQEWLEFFFARHYAPDSTYSERSQAFWDEIRRHENCDAAYPGKLLGYIERMCIEHENVLVTYSTEQIEQGLWAIFATFRHPDYLFKPAYCPVVEATLDEKRRCIEAMYDAFAAIAKRTDVDWSETFYFMWWDEVIFSHFRRPMNEENLPANLRRVFEQLRELGQDLSAFDLSKASSDQLHLLDAVFRTLVKILALPHPDCQRAALHGLGHMPSYPGRAETVERYLQQHGAEMAEEDRIWVERCRDGIVL